MVVASLRAVRCSAERGVSKSVTQFDVEARPDATRAALRGGGANKVPDEAKREAPLQPPFGDDD